MKLFVPSWVIPGTYLENLRFLDDKKTVSGVELLFFMYDDEVRRELANEFSAIAAYRGRFEYTAHLPDSLLPEHAELVEKLLPIVRHFVVHPARDEAAVEREAVFLRGWFDAYGLEKFVIENTSLDSFCQLAGLLSPDAGLCMDTGHLLLAEASPLEFAQTHKGRIREIHLHGLDREAAKTDGRLPDHRPPRAGDAWLAGLAPFLRGFDEILNLEVFSWAEASASIAAIEMAGIVSA